MIKSFAATLCCLLGLASLSVVNADTPLELSMQRMGKAFKQLSLDLKQPVDASKDDYVALANSLKTESQKSRELVPKKAAALPPDQQATMVAAYQKSMDQLSTTIDGLIADLQSSQWDAARQQLDSVKKQMFDGHKEFRGKNKGPVPPPAPAAAASGTPPPAAPDTTAPAQPTTPATTTPAQ